jgi:xanthine dehydrogenase accessory factor
LERLTSEPAVLVTVGATQGSAPRDAGAWMVVFADEVRGTVGGGHLEWMACEWAREMVRSEGPPTQERRFALGPSLGQCCGGVVYLQARRVDAADVPALREVLRPRGVPVALFGGGHVGRAIVRALAPLPFDVRWIDSRDEVFPMDLPVNVKAEHSDPVEAAVADLPAQTRVLIMSFSHAEDLAVVDACLKRQQRLGDLPFVGLIGSRSKWAAFRHRLEARGHDEAALARVTCPIGLPGIEGKAPEVIAASVAAQLLMLPEGASQGLS